MLTITEQFLLAFLSLAIIGAALAYHLGREQGDTFGQSEHLVNRTAKSSRAE